MAKKASANNSPLSMTGFGSARGEGKGVVIEVEVKSANSRYLDLSFRLPRLYNSLESELRELISELIHRGRFELTVNRTVSTQGEVEVQFNKDAFQALWKVYKGVAKDLSLKEEGAKVDFARDILARREVLNISETSPDVGSEEKLLLATTKKALDELLATRTREGLRLEQDLLGRVQRISEIRSKIATKIATKPEIMRDRLLQAIKNLTGEINIDESRLCTEVALLVDRSDITEELVRLSSHLEHFESAIKSRPVGKKLDFIVQELVREVNTIGSKAQDAEIQSLVVEAKTEIERIREQVQNLE